MKFLAKRPVLFALLMAWLVLAVGAVHAQSPNNLSAARNSIRRCPAPLPPPKIETPEVRKLDAPQHYDYRPAPRASFGDRNRPLPR